MQLEGVYKDGLLILDTPARIRSGRVKVTIEVPDDTPVIAPSSQSPSTEMKTHERLNAIMGHWRCSDGPPRSLEYKAIWHAHLEDKYFGQK
jgi:hypothetical protein